MDKFHRDKICRRISQLRKRVCGRRGKSAFAEKLRLSPSTYDYYERGRLPPADVLVAIADLAEVDLRWLITGVEPVGPAIPSRHPLVRRVAEMLAERPNAAEALGAFLDILGQTMKFPGVGAVDQTSKPGAGSERPKGEQAWIPILGRSAAGVPHFWSAQQASGTTRLAELMPQRAGRGIASTRRARTGATEASPPSIVQIVTLRQAEPGKPTEFVADEYTKATWPDAFAVRIDGESMSPDIAHGDLVLLSPSAPAVSGKSAVIQLANQVGVTCKILRSSGQKVHLVPINEEFAPQTFPAEAVQWALRVLARVRPE